MSFKLLGASFFIFYFVLNFFVSRYDIFYFSSIRFYDPKIGRFAKADAATPAPDSQGSNRYTYVFNQPFKFTDPDGHVPQSSSDDVGNGFLGLIGQGVKAFNRYDDSGKGWFARQRYRWDMFWYQRDVHKYLSREVLTGIHVVGISEIPDAADKVTKALQALAGEQATIRTFHLPGTQADLSMITYQQNPENLGDGSHSSRSWVQLKESFDVTIPLIRTPHGVFIEPVSYLSRMGRSLARRGAHGQVMPNPQAPRSELMIFSIADFEKLPDPQIKKEAFGYFSVNLGHELKHARDIIKGGKQIDHSDSSFSYLFYDDPNFIQDILYSKAYNENNPNAQIPEISDIPDHPQNVYLRGLTARKVFKSMGIHVDKMEPSE